ncbi:hypothetical protein CPB86DRAFT_829717 [Serendipita vermifera]|nr:hypothetical protein CPB86DRAFT_829717 [Serendipita vermifera]
MSDIYGATTELENPRIGGASSITWESLRWQLQDDITHLLNNPQNEQKLQEKKNSYNKVIDMLRDIEIGRRVDPLEKLPNEINTAILLNMSSSTEEWYISRDLDEFLPLLLVSKRWQSFITSEPLLWNYIELSDDASMRRIARQLELSRALPLTLKIEFPLGQSWGSLCEELVKHRDRIQVIVFKDSSYRKEGRNLDLRKVLESLSPLPSLWHLGESFGPSYDTYAHEVCWLLSEFPSLRGLHNIPLQTQDLEMASNRLNLQEIQTYDDLNEFMSTSEAIRSVRKVTLLNVIGKFGGREAKSDWTPQSSQLLGWTHFKWNRYTAPFPVSLLHRLLNLTSLYFGGSLPIIKNIVSIIHQFPNLGFFEAFVSLGHGDDLSPPPKLLPNHRTHTLKMLISPPDNYNLPDHPEERERLMIECHKIPEMMLCAMPRAEYLKISIIGGQSPFPFFSLKEFFSGKELFIYFSECTAIPSEDMQIPSSVETLSLDCNWSALCLLSSNSLKSLDLLQDFDEDAADGDLQDLRSPVVPLERQIDLTAWPSLETIGLYKNWVQWGQASLASLRIVSIWESEDDDIVDNVTYFVREIACRPESYPSLEEIHLGACPEWDILVIMLERRNLLAGSKIKRIKEIRIPSSLPHQIHRIIAELLRCKWSDRPSNRYLSLSGNAETILDPTRTGCYVCHRVLRPCKEPIISKWEIFDKQEEVLAGELLYKYPDSAEDVLASWPTRAILWDQWNRARSWREVRCSDQRASYMVVVDTDSYPQPNAETIVCWEGKILDTVPY